MRDVRLSGWDFSRRRQRSRKGSEAARATNRYPLRAVVDDAYPEHVLVRSGLNDDFILRAVLLECGHVLPQARDMIGVRYPARRRCRKCAEGLPRDVAES
jgi:hypothetical protein